MVEGCNSARFLGMTVWDYFAYSSERVDYYSTIFLKNHFGLMDSVKFKSSCVGVRVACRVPVCLGLYGAQLSISRACASPYESLFLAPYQG